MIEIQPNPTNFRRLGLFDVNPPPSKLNELQDKTRQAFLNAIEDGRIVLNERKKCLCGGTEFSKIAAMDRFGLPFGSYLCSDCGLIFTSPFISQNSLPLYYDEFYHKLTFGREADPSLPLYQKGQGEKIFNILKNRLSPNNLKILEIGAGSGSVMKEFMKAAKNDGFELTITGFDYGSEYINQFDPEGYNLTMLQGGLDEAARGGCTYDVVIMSHVFEHFADPSQELESLKRIIGPDSLIFIEVPGVLSLKSRYVYDCDFLIYLVSAHMFNFNLASLTRTLNLNGFKLLWGNEEAETIFTLGEQAVDVSENAAMIKAYLEDSEISRPLYASLSPLRLKNSLGITKIEDRTKGLEDRTKGLEDRTKGLEDRTKIMESQMIDAMERVQYLSNYINDVRSSLPYRVLSWIYRMLKNAIPRRIK